MSETLTPAQARALKRQMNKWIDEITGPADPGHPDLDLAMRVAADHGIKIEPLKYDKFRVVDARGRSSGAQHSVAGLAKALLYIIDRDCMVIPSSALAEIIGHPGPMRYQAAAGLIHEQFRHTPRLSKKVRDFLGRDVSDYCAARDSIFAELTRHNPVRSLATDEMRVAVVAKKDAQIESQQRRQFERLKAVFETASTTSH